jgi:hypothetical protein
MRLPALLLCLTALAADLPAPKITLEQQAEWLQARAELLEAQLAVKTAEGKLLVVVTKLQAVCPLVLNPQGRPECAPPQPAPEKKEGAK